MTSPQNCRVMQPSARDGLIRLGIVFLALSCLGTPFARAHDPGLSTATMQLETNKLQAVLVFSLLDAAQIVEMDKDHDGQISKTELAGAAAQFQQIAAQSLEVSLDNQPIQAEEARCRFDESDNVSIHLTFPVITFSNLVVRSKWLTLLQPGHRQFFSLQNPAGDTLAEQLLSANSDVINLQMDALEAKATTNSRKNSFADFLLMGAKHIWTGYDHLLFLFGLLIVTRNFGSAVKIITCFTIAHSITLAIATLSLVRFSSRFVE